MSASENRPPTPDDARRCVTALWGESGVSATLLGGDVDVNVRVVDPGGTASILKFVHPETSADELGMQAGVLSHLEGRLEPGTFPAPIRLPDGADTGEFEGRRVRRLRWVDGHLLADARPLEPRRSAERRLRLPTDLGGFLARLDRALEGFEHPALERPHGWDPLAPAGLEARVDAVPAGDRRDLVLRVVERWSRYVAPRGPELPRAVIHGDGHERNVLVDRLAHPSRVTGIFDFGDLLRTARVCEPAIAAAYAAMRTSDPLDGACAVFAGYDAELPLTEAELAVAFDLLRTRLAISVTHSAERSAIRDDPYATISEADAWRVLESLDPVAPARATARIRHACGRESVPGARAVAAWLAEAGDRVAPILPESLRGVPRVVDLSIASGLPGSDPTDPDPERVNREVARVAEAGAPNAAIGRWSEPRVTAIDAEAGVHMGVDLFVPGGTPVSAPLDGEVVSTSPGGAAGRGAAVLLRHAPDGGPGFSTLWAYLDPEVVGRLRPGDRVAAGGSIGRVDPAPASGRVPPHLHLQVAVESPEDGHGVPGLVPARLREYFGELFPNPAALLGLPDDVVAYRDPSLDDLRARRAATMAPNLSLSYAEPIELVRGWRQHVWDGEGRHWLDLYNNVPHVGHAHPRVTEAIARQSGLFAANTRYLSRVRQDYLDRLIALFPSGFDTAFLLPSASEANEVALRLARVWSGRRGVVVQEAGYHGHTTGLVDVSPYKALGPGGHGLPPHVRAVPIPDPYRGRHRGPESGPAYAAEVRAVLDAMAEDGTPAGAFLAETLPSVGGQVIPPEGYAGEVAEAVRAAGALVIADEVQTGFGRLGRWFWGFEQQGFVPDVVVLGKPMANGYPMGAVVTRREVADAFANGMEFFSTFGGNPVACAAGAAVLDVLAGERLPERAAAVGERLLGVLRAASADHPAIGEVRGLGLFAGVVCVRDRTSRAPAPAVARYLVERLKEEGVLAGTDGPEGEVVKLRGPLTVEGADVERVGEIWSRILDEPGTQPEPAR